MRAYSVYRPIGMGTYPRGYEVSDIVNFDHLQWIEEIQHNAFGYVEFASDVPECDLEAYELKTRMEVPSGFRAAVRAIVEAHRHGYSEDRIDKMISIAERKGIDAEELWAAVDAELGIM